VSPELVSPQVHLFSLLSRNVCKVPVVNTVRIGWTTKGGQSYVTLSTFIFPLVSQCLPGAGGHPPLG